MQNGKVPGKFEVVVMEIIPKHYALIDGAHRVCAWQILCDANPNLEDKKIAALVLSSNMSWEQVEIVAGGQNGLPQKAPSLTDLVIDFYLIF